jgi:hypothetical protein
MANKARQEATVAKAVPTALAALGRNRNHGADGPLRFRAAAEASPTKRG